jgi:hypothetical protein
MKKIKGLVLFFLLIESFLPAQIALADTGPKPRMEFTFKQEQDLLPMSITSGIMYECDQSDCSDGAPLQELGPQRFTCDVSSCSATAYGFSPFHKIEIQFSDGKTRSSNIFQTAGFDSNYTVTVRPEDLLVEAKFSPGILPPVFLIIITCICALVGIGLVVGLIIFLVRRSKIF